MYISRENRAKKKGTQRLTFWVRRPLGLPCEGVVAKNFVLSLESSSSLGFEERNLGCPGNFLPGCPGPLGVLQKFVLKKFVRSFRSLEKHENSKHSITGGKSARKNPPKIKKFI